MDSRGQRVWVWVCDSVVNCPWPRSVSFWAWLSGSLGLSMEDTVSNQSPWGWVLPGNEEQWLHLQTDLVQMLGLGRCELLSAQL